MKSAFLVVFSIFGMAFHVMADTVSHWSVRFNDSLVLYGNVATAAPELRISADLIEPLDLLSVQYVRDTPCPSCPIKVLVEDELGQLVVSGDATRTFSPVKIPVYPMSNYGRKGRGTGLLNVFFQESGDAQRRALLFRIRLE